MIWRKNLIDSSKPSPHFLLEELRTQVSLHRNENWNPKTDVNSKKFSLLLAKKTFFCCKLMKEKCPNTLILGKKIFSAIKVRNNQSRLLHCFFTDGCPWNIIYLFYNLWIGRYYWKTHSLHFQRLRSFAFSRSRQFDVLMVGVKTLRPFFPIRNQLNFSLPLFAFK